VHLSISDGPVVNLALKLQGTPATKADPLVTKTLSDGNLAEPAPVVLAGGQMEMGRAH